MGCRRTRKPRPCMTPLGPPGKITNGIWENVCCQRQKAAQVEEKSHPKRSFLVQYWLEIQTLGPIWVRNLDFGPKRGLSAGSRAGEPRQGPPGLSSGCFFIKKMLILVNLLSESRAGAPATPQPPRNSPQLGDAGNRGATGGTSGSTVVLQIPLNSPKFALFDPKGTQQGTSNTAAQLGRGRSTVAATQDPAVEL